MPGPISRDEFLTLWKGVTDSAYHQPLSDAGDGYGLEVYTQLSEQLARVSLSIDKTTQAMFILPWSGQTDDSAQGEAKATVDITLTRTKHLGIPLLLLPGEFFIEEQTTDVGQDAPLTVTTGRRFTPVSPVVLFPGFSSGTFTFVAEAPGYGYNNPAPNTLSAIPQPGSKFKNDRAYIVVGSGSDTLFADNRADTFIPDHVGRYVLLTEGVNAGSIERVLAYNGPNLSLSPPSGGSVLLDPLVVFQGKIMGGFTLVEPCQQAGSGANGIVLAQDTSYSSPYHMALVRRTSGQFAATGSLTGLLTLSTIVPGIAITKPVNLTAEPPIPTPPVAWKILDWVEDFGLTVTNAKSPSGGRIGMLDTLGAERRIYRVPGETDASYSKRISQIADVVTPNALRRAANRVLAPYGAAGCLREAGLFRLPGLFFDTPSDQHGAFDLDCFITTVVFVFLPFPLTEGDRVQFVMGPGDAVITDSIYAGRVGSKYFFVRLGLSGNWKFIENEVTAGNNVFINFISSGDRLQVQTIIQNGPRVEDRFRYIFSYDEMRAFFLMGVPPSAIGDFGFFYDVGAFSAYDSSPFLTFYDGFAVNTASQRLSVWQSLLKTKAGGVGFDLYLEDIGCVI